MRIHFLYREYPQPWKPVSNWLALRWNDWCGLPFERRLYALLVAVLLIALYKGIPILADQADAGLPNNPRRRAGKKEGRKRPEGCRAAVLANGKRRQWLYFLYRRLFIFLKYCRFKSGFRIKLGITEKSISKFVHRQMVDRFGGTDMTDDLLWITGLAVVFFTAIRSIRWLISLIRSFKRSVEPFLNIFMGAGIIDLSVDANDSSRRRKEDKD